MVTSNFVDQAISADAAPAMVVPGQFDVSATGSFTYNVPIAVPPGTGGMSPSLSLDYSSHSGDGLEGLGWVLSGLPTIGRCPRTVAQDGVHGSVNYDSNDRFCMEGQRLVLITPGGTYGADGTEYRTEIEGFSRIIAHGTVASPGVGPKYFEVHTKAGQVMYFGWSEDLDNSGNNSRIFLSTNNPTVRVWAVEKIIDSKSNYLAVKYVLDTQTIGSDTETVQARPTEIDYTGNAHSVPALAPYAAVKFLYQDRAAAQIIPNYHAGYLTETTKLLSNVQTFVGSSPGTMITDYRLAYNTLSTTIQRYELASITQCDNSSPANCLKPTTFGWAGSRNSLTLTPTDRAITNNGAVTAGDYTGDGLTDLLSGSSTNCGIYNGPDFQTAGPGTLYYQWHYDSENHTYYYDHFPRPACFGSDGTTIPLPTSTLRGTVDVNDDGFADALITQRTDAGTYSLFPLINSGTRLDQPGSNNPYGISLNPTDVLDFDGDGRTDIFGPGSSLGAPIHIDVGDGTGSFSCTTPCTTYSATDQFTFADFDGDGCSDILERGTTNQITYSFLCNSAVPSTSIDGWLSSEVVLGDFNGDGKVDILVAPQNGQATLYLSTGKGFAAGIGLTGFTDWGKYVIYTGDWNGDGMADILLVAAGTSGLYGPGTSHKIYLSTGTGFVQASGAAGSIANTNSGDTNVSATVADWNNDGASDIWLQRNGSGDAEYSFSYTPEVITTVNNGIGANTIVTYAPLNQNGSLYQKCPATGTFYCSYAYPNLGVDGPIYVVQRVDSSNSLGTCVPPTNCYSSTYSYGQALFDLSGRGFLGFQTVSSTDLQTSIVQTTTYATDFPRTGLVLSQTKTCPDQMAGCPVGGVSINSTQNTYDVVQLGTGADGVKREFVARQTTTAKSNDLDGTPLPTITTTYTYDCDTMSGGSSICAGNSPTGFGNTTLIVIKDLTDNSTKTTTNTYTNDAANWYLARLLTATVENVVGSSDLIRQTSYCYDLSYVPAGTSCSTNANPTGLLTQEIVEPETSTDPTLRVETDYTYDSFGNKNTSIGKGCVWVTPGPTCSTTTPTATRETDTQYDHSTNQGQFPTKTTNALGQFETWAYTNDATKDNTGFGLPSSHTGPNGLTTSWKYDTFGRKILETRPDGNQTAFGYYTCTNAACAGLPTGITAVHPHTHFIAVATPEDSTGAQNGPITVTYYDSLSRSTGSDVEGFDGAGTGCTLAAPCWVRVQTQYDANGRAYRTSRPYFLATGTPLWTTNSYDVLGRVYLNVQPGNISTSYGFDGLTNTVQNDKGQITTTVKNAEGLVASVEDNDSNITTYAYDAFGDLTKITDPSTNNTRYTYDIRGRKITAHDPDMGNWSYVYDGFGELYSQTDAKSQVVTITYDALGRILTKTEPDLSSSWTYDTASGKGVGQLASATTGSTYTRTPAYDALGRVQANTIAIDGTPSTYSIGYDSNGRIQTVGYPSGFTAKYTYTPLGYLQQVSDNGGTHQVYWTANTRDAELRLLTQTAGNSVVTTEAFDPNTGRPLSILAGASNAISNQTFTFDTLGNLTQRSWLNNAGASVNENACYDDLNRLTSTKVASGSSCLGGAAIVTTYDALGNITSKSDVCSAANCFGYGASGAGPHALTSIVGTYNGVINPTFSYDLNGNMVSGAGRTVTSTSFNMASFISDGGNTASLTYNTEHARIKQVATGAGAGTTYYLNDPASGAMAEKLVGATTNWRDYIMADGKMVAQRTCGAVCSTAPAVEYFVLDHLGSISVITDPTGAVIERLSYDAWGKRRNADGTAAACGMISSSTTRGFTGQEMMDGVCFVNFNARVYDPSLGRFMSADPVTQDAYSLQFLNRYSYVGNNPLSLTDPTGNCAGFFGCLFGILTFGLLDPLIEPLIRSNPILGDLLIAWTAIECGPCAGLAAGGVAGIRGGKIGQIFEAAALTAFEAEGMQLIGGTDWSLPTKALASGLVGGVTNLAGGGKFGPGFLAAGFSTLANPYVGLIAGDNRLLGGVISATLGGASSVLGGGKFANGAITAAFAYAASLEYGPSEKNLSRDTQEENYSITRDHWFSAGMQIDLDYTGTVPGARWVQTITATTDPTSGRSPPYVDPLEDPSEPFYYTDAEEHYPSVRNGNNYYFMDNPERSIWGDHFFQAEVSLVAPDSSGGYKILGNWTWGFGETWGIVMPLPLTASTPSSFQQSVIQGIGK